jgi:hypothetical protein
MAAIAGYDEARRILAHASLAMVATYDQVAILKEQAASANIHALTADLAKLTTINARYDAAPDVVPPDADDVLAAIVRAFPAAPSAIAST